MLARAVRGRVYPVVVLGEKEVQVGLWAVEPSCKEVVVGTLMEGGGERGVVCVRAGTHGRVGTERWAGESGPSVVGESVVVLAVVDHLCFPDGKRARGVRCCWESGVG